LYIFSLLQTDSDDGAQHVRNLLLPVSFVQQVLVQKLDRDRLEEDAKQHQARPKNKL
jgi:hypothetical protein